MRKLLGYRPVSDLYERAFCILNNITEIEGLIPKGSTGYEWILKYGVMHWFEEVYEEEELEVGKWYRSDMNGLWFVEEGEEGRQKSYGINYKGEWRDSMIRNSTGLKPATDKEVEEALIKEAKKRGFKDGVKVKSSDGATSINPLRFKQLEYVSEYNMLTDGWGNTLFEDSQWAEIIEEPKPNLHNKTAIIDGVEYKLKMKS